MSEEIDSLTDEEIFLKISKDADLFGYIVDRYEDKMKRYILRNSGFNKFDIDDLLQDIFLAVYQNANSFRFDMKFSSWIYRIAHNKIVDYWRKNQKNKNEISVEENLFLVESIFNKNEVEDEIEKTESKEIVQKVLPFVKEKYRQVLVLRFLEEKSYEEISDILEKTKATVGTLVRRGKEDFKKQMENLSKNKK